eukprot:CAMPEP_0194408652 /NCGR_PEP_ID=MMETSP0176-20130528/6445_1 /TAXON_ID=216777 /ORGANISM="Proboscia alata, Strain PI-D3" /LENGTH=451 /DNA_ID=CAMNT_0039208793 /DNA_START=84 /DNA_END=1437 /DNA_ORIENTATION=-
MNLTSSNIIRLLVVIGLFTLCLLNIITPQIEQLYQSADISLGTIAGNGTIHSNQPATVTSAVSGNASIATLDAEYDAVAIARRRNETLFPPPKDHPFAGARDANGYWGYVADPTSVRTTMLARFQLEQQLKSGGSTTATDAKALTIDDMIAARYMPLTRTKKLNGLPLNETELICQKPPGKSIEGNKGGWYILAKKVVIGGPLPLPTDASDPREPAKGWKHANKGNETNHPNTPYFNTPDPPKVFCGLYTYHKRRYLQEAVVETWAWRCDGFLAFSDETDPTLGAVDLPHQGDEGYSNMWQKNPQHLDFIYINYADQYDYFHVSGDDVLMIVENLRNYLWSIDDENGTKPLYIGGRADLGRNTVTCGGGAGYTMNKVTLEWLVKGPFSKPDKRKASSEDRFMGQILNSFVDCYDTWDANGAKRYIGFDPKFAATADGIHGNKFMLGQMKMW